MTGNKKGQPLADPKQYLNDPRIVAEIEALRARRLISGGAIDLNVDETARQKDQRWFERHPYRNYRLRKMTRLEIEYFNGEYLSDKFKPLGVKFNIVFLRQIRTGWRSKHPLWLKEPLTQNHPLTYSGADIKQHMLVDEALRALWGHMASVTDTGLFAFTTTELMERAAYGLSMGGRIQ